MEALESRTLMEYAYYLDRALVFFAISRLLTFVSFLPIKPLTGGGEQYTETSMSIILLVCVPHKPSSESDPDLIFTRNTMTFC